MSYASVSSSSFDMLPVSLDTPSARPARRARVSATSRPAGPRRARYQIVEQAERALYLSLALGFAVMVYGFLQMFHLGL